MLSSDATTAAHPPLGNSRVVRDGCAQQNHTVSRGRLDFCTIHTPYYDYYPFDIKQMKKE